MPESVKQLLLILADGRFHSGTALAKALKLSRSAIWKQIQVLADWGVEVVAVSGKGYKCVRPIHLLNRQQIESALHPEVSSLLLDLEIHDSIASTNAYLLSLARQEPASGRVCLAEFQSAGKGRRGRHWVSPFGHNIYLSLLWCYPDGPAAIAGLSLVIGVCVIRVLRSAGIADVGLKWPNDILWQGRKLAGILIEVSGESSGPSHAVVGLGLNFYLPPDSASGIEQAWVDLAHIMGEGVSLQRNQWVAALLNELLPVVADFQAHSLIRYLAEWRSYDCLLGQSVTLYFGEYGHTGVVRGIDDQGQLILEGAQGQNRSFASGEVSFRVA